MMGVSDQDIEKIEEMATDALSPDLLREMFEGFGMSEDQIANALQIAGKMLATPGWADKLLPLVRAQQPKKRQEEKEQDE
jgi:hypothetical protein